LGAIIASSPITAIPYVPSAIGLLRENSPPMRRQLLGENSASDFRGGKFLASFSRKDFLLPRFTLNLGTF
jgi:hypothetical protein